jgi:hypothetical protein
MPDVGIPIMRWGNWLVITKVLRDMLLAKLHDDLLTLDEVIEVVTAWLTRMEDVPYFIILMPSVLGSVLKSLGINWNAKWDHDRVELIANVIVAILKSFA